MTIIRRSLALGLKSLIWARGQVASTEAERQALADIARSSEQLLRLSCCCFVYNVERARCVPGECPVHGLPS